MSDDKPDDTRLNKAEKLAVTGAVASSVRKGAEQASKRRVARVDKDGNIVGYTSLALVQQALLAKHALEIEVQPGVRPSEAPCKKCGLPLKVSRVGGVPQKCRACARGKCFDCGALVNNHKRKHPSKRCRDCLAKRATEKGRVRTPMNCKYCGKQLSLNASNTHAAKTTGSAACRPCKESEERRLRAEQCKCGTCGSQLNSKVMTPFAIKRRGGRPPTCTACRKPNAETIEKMRVAATGRLSPLRGRKLSEKHKAKLRKPRSTEINT